MASSAGAGSEVVPPEINEEDALFYENRGVYTIVLERTNVAGQPDRSIVMLEGASTPITVLNAALFYLDGETGLFYPFKVDDATFARYIGALGIPMSDAVDDGADYDDGSGPISTLERFIDGIMSGETELLINQKPLVNDGSLPPEVSSYTPEDHGGFGMDIAPEAVSAPAPTAMSVVEEEPSMLENLLGMKPAPAPATPAVVSGPYETLLAESSKESVVDEETLLATYRKTAEEVVSEIRENNALIASETVKQIEIAKRVRRIRTLPTTAVPLEPILEEQKQVVRTKAVKVLNRGSKVIKTASNQIEILSKFDGFVKRAAAPGVRRVDSLTVAHGARSANLFGALLDDTNKQLVRIYQSKQTILAANDGKLSCYICGEYVNKTPEFEHLMHFLASMTKGLLSSKENVRDLGKETYIQRCVAEWACAVCNGKSGKSQDDLSNHSKLGAERKDWGDLKPDMRAIEALLTRVWSKFSKDNDERLRTRYNTLANFISSRKGFVADRFDWNCKVIKTYVDFERYNACKKFLYTLNVAAAVDNTIDVGGLMCKYLNEKSPLKLSEIPDHDILKEPYMLLNEPHTTKQSHTQSGVHPKELKNTQGQLFMAGLFATAGKKRRITGGTRKSKHVCLDCGAHVSRRQLKWKTQKVKKRRGGERQVRVEIVPL
jgi:hypothetical protein